MNWRKAWSALWGKDKTEAYRRARAYAKRASAYDGALTNNHNQNHWSNVSFTDGNNTLLGDDSLTIVRARVRHEMRNNTYALGAARKYANYIVGTGPKLQMLGSTTTTNERVEALFEEWANDPENFDAVGAQSYAEMLRLCVEELFPSGEYFRQWMYDMEAPTQMKLRSLLVAPERVSTPSDLSDSIIAGIEQNAIGKPVRYWVSNKYPSSYEQFTLAAGSTLESAKYSAVDRPNMIHTLISDQPEMLRGTPLGAAVLNVFATMRRFDEATIRAAEMAALFAAFMTTDAPDQYDPDVDPEQFEIEAGTFTTLPPGSDIKQVTPQHPSSVYETFKRGKLTDAGASTSLPYNVLASDSSGHNYASGRLDWQGLIRAVKVRRQWLCRHDCNRVFERWYKEASLVYGLPAKMPKYKWMWPGFEHVDPMKEAQAAVLRIQNNLQTYQDYFAGEGKDYRDEFAQMSTEEDQMEQLGIVVEPSTSGNVAGNDTDDDEQEIEDE